MLNQQELLNDIRNELVQNIDDDCKSTIKNHFKMNVDHFLGVKTPVIRKIANQFFQLLKKMSADEVLQYCEAILETKIYEEKIIAFHWSFKIKKQYRLKHFETFQKWLELYVDEWIDCDDFSTHTLGYFLFEYPECYKQLLKWSQSDNKWLRRASAVSLIYSLRRGKALDIAFKITDKLMDDQDHLVQKGYGWMLKEASKNFPDQVFKFLKLNESLMPRLAIRFAAEKLSVVQKKQLIKK